MNAEQFAYWVQGAIELGGAKQFNEYQTQIIQDHLNLVLNKVTPQYGDITSSPVNPNWLFDKNKFTVPTITC